MYRRTLDFHCVLMLLAAALMWLGTTRAIAQTETDPVPSDTEVTDVPDEPVDEPANATNPPRYITELMEDGLLTQDQAGQLRLEGLGWGEIRIVVRLAEAIAAADGQDVPLADVLANVLAEYNAGKGFGEIANENDLKIGELLGNGNKRKMAPATGTAGGLESQQGAGTGQTRQVTQKRQGSLARLGRFLGFGKKAQVKQDLATTNAETSGDMEQVRNTEKTQKVERVAKAERLERPARPEKVERPERPAKPEKPERPERPERGPNR